MKNFLKTGIAAVAGITFGLLFAKKSGKQLRNKLSKSETPLKDLMDEFKGVAENSKEFASDSVKNSAELKKITEAGKAKLEEMKKVSKNLGAKAESKIDGLMNKAKEALEEAKDVAEEAMEDLKEGAEEMKSKAEETVRKFKNEVKK